MCISSYTAVIQRFESLGQVFKENILIAIIDYGNDLDLKKLVDDHVKVPCQLSSTYLVDIGHAVSVRQVNCGLSLHKYPIDLLSKDTVFSISSDLSYIGRINGVQAGLPSWLSMLVTRFSFKMGRGGELALGCLCSAFSSECI